MDTSKEAPTLEMRAKYKDSPGATRALAWVVRVSITCFAGPALAMGGEGFARGVLALRFWFLSGLLPSGSHSSKTGPPIARAIHALARSVELSLVDRVGVRRPAIHRTSGSSSRGGAAIIRLGRSQPGFRQRVHQACAASHTDPASRGNALPKTVYVDQSDVGFTIEDRLSRNLADCVTAATTPDNEVAEMLLRVFRLQ